METAFPTEFRREFLITGVNPRNGIAIRRPIRGTLERKRSQQEFIPTRGETENRPAGATNDAVSGACGIALEGVDRGDGMRNFRPPKEDVGQTAAHLSSDPIISHWWALNIGSSNGGNEREEKQAKSESLHSSYIVISQRH